MCIRPIGGTLYPDSPDTQCLCDSFEPGRIDRGRRIGAGCRLGLLLAGRQGGTATSNRLGIGPVLESTRLLSFAPSHLPKGARECLMVLVPRGSRMIARLP